MKGEEGGGLALHYVTDGLEALTKTPKAMLQKCSFLSSRTPSNVDACMKEHRPFDQCGQIHC